MVHAPARCGVRRLAARIVVAALAASWAIGPVSGADVRLTRVPEKSPTQLEISGGSGRKSWRLRYGTYFDFATQAQLVSVAGNRAWFSHGGWLRLIDTEKGLVIGRWHFPGQIVHLVPQETRVQVDIEMKLGDQRLRRTLTLDPGARAEVPYWRSGWLILERLPMTELESGWRVKPNSDLLNTLGKISGEHAKRLIPELEEAARRDPDSPWIQVGLAKLMRDAGDPRSPAVFESALGVPTTDFTELLPIAGFLERLGEHNRARAFFDRGYEDYWRHGNDPRMFTELLDRLILYQPFLSDRGANLATEPGREIVERLYRLQPNGAEAEYAWRVYAESSRKTARPDEARIWRTRAEEARVNSMFLLEPPFSLLLDHSVLVFLGAFFAAVIYTLILIARYQRQRRTALAARGRVAKFWRGLSLFSLQYWSRRERVALLTIVLPAWYAAGVAGVFGQAVLRQAATPLGTWTGSLRGPASTSFFESFPQTPERDLLLAFAYQQNGENDKAERLYRSLPRFAESWNNLGVLLKEAGKDREARQAFEQALQLDLNLAEGALNLDQPPHTLWTELHQKYLSGRPMLAPPGPERIRHAYLGGSWREIFLRALAGPVLLWGGEPFSLIEKLS